MRILRHEIAITDYQEIQTCGELLSVAVSRMLPDHLIDLWSLDEDREYECKAVYVVGTGNPMSDDLRFGAPRNGWRKFIGTVVTPSGLVWHVFGGPIQ